MIGATDLYGVAAVIAAVGSSISAVLAVLVARPIRQTRDTTNHVAAQVRTKNGHTLGQVAEAVADHVGATPAELVPPAAGEDDAPEA